MSRPEWFRRTTWTDADRQDFNARFQRSRGPGNKAQYLRIQASHLAEADCHHGAIELLDRLLTEFPDRIQLAQAHSQKAASLAKLGQTEGAIVEYRAALQCERDFPTVRTNAWLDFGWLVVERRLNGLYLEITSVLDEFRDETALKFPAVEYRYAALQSLLADARGEQDRAREFARKALAEAAKEHSGLRNHPTVGVVRGERDSFGSRLRALAGW